LAAKLSRLPPFMVKGPVPRAPPLARAKVPAVTMVPPVFRFAPPKTSVPAPYLVVAPAPFGKAKFQVVTGLLTVTPLPKL